jgi:zinc/manganese transport system substrate-binding protein
MTVRRLRTAVLLGATLLATGLLAVVSSVRADAAPAPAVQVVAAENFWGNIAAQIGGSHVSVTSLITDPNADPHLFQTNALDAAKLAGAQVVIENGAGYDGWMGSLLGADGGHPRIVTAASALHVTGSNPNPHLWYDIPRVPAVASAITSAFVKADPNDAAMFRSNLATFDASLVPLKNTIASIKKQFAHAPVAYTERVPGYLLGDAGLHVVTPPGFAQAVEDGTDPSAADTVAMQKLLTHHDIDVLLYNVQTVTSVTTQIRTLAQRNHIPIVGVSETLPANAATYQQWQAAQLNALHSGLLASRGP